MKRSAEFREIETRPAAILEQPDPPQPKPLDPEAYALQQVLSTLIQLGAASHPRARSSTIGISQLGKICDRELSYIENGTPPVNVSDPLRALIGTGLHMALADLFRRLDNQSGRFVVEQPVAFRGIPGTLDFLDRHTGILVDWKTTTKAKITQIRYQGPPQAYIIQLQAYAAALVADGEKVGSLALAYLPVDSTLEDMYVWRATFEQAAADKAADRLNQIRFKEPQEVKPNPSELCKWCPYHRPHSNLTLNTACPGKETT